MAEATTFFRGLASSCSAKSEDQATSQPQFAGASGLTFTPAFSSVSTHAPSDPVCGHDPPPRAKIMALAWISIFNQSELQLSYVYLDIILGGFFHIRKRSWFSGFQVDSPGKMGQ